LTGTSIGRRNRKTTHTLEELTAVQLEGGRLGGEVRFSSDGRLVVETCSNGEVKIWDAGTGHQVSYFPPGNSTKGVLTEIGVEAARQRRERDYSYSADAPPNGAAEFLFRLVSDDGRRVATARSFFTQGDGRNRSANHFSWLVEDPLREELPIVISTHDPNYFFDNELPDPGKCAISPDSRWLLDGDRLFEIDGPSRATQILPSLPDDAAIQFSRVPGRLAMLEKSRHGYTKAHVWNYESVPDRLFAGESRNRGGGKVSVAANIPVPGNGYVFGSFSGDSRSVVTFALGDPVACVWDALSGALKQRCEVDEQTKYAALSAEGSRLCVISRSGRLSLWNCANGTRLADIGGNLEELSASSQALPASPKFGPIHFAQFSPSGERVAICTEDGVIGVIDASTGATIYVVDGTFGEATDLRFVGDGSVLLAKRSSVARRPVNETDNGDRTSKHDLVRAIAAETGAQLYEFSGRLLAVSSDGGKLVVGRLDDTVVISALSGTVDWSVPTAMTAAAFCGERLLMAQGEGDVDIQDFDPLSGTPMGSFSRISKGYATAKLEVFLQSTAAHVIAAYHFWQLPNFHRRHNGAYLVGSSYRGQETSFEVRVLSGISGALIFEKSVYHAVVGASADSVVLAGSDGLFHVKDGKIVATIANCYGVTHLAISPDGLLLLVGFHSGRSQLFCLANGFKEVTLSGHGHQQAPSPAGIFGGFDPTGEFLLTHDEGVSIWDIAGERRALHVAFGEAKVTSTDFSVDGSKIIALCNDGVARIIDKTSGKEDTKLCVQGAAIGLVRHGPEVGTLATICSDATLRLFDDKTGDLLAVERVGLVDAITCALPNNVREIAAVCGGVIRRWRFKSAGVLTNKDTDHFRLDGHPLKSKADVAAYLRIPMPILDRALKGGRNEPRYKSYELPKRTGGKRRIDAPTGILRLLQQQISPLLQAAYETHPSAHGFVMGRSIVTNAAPHTGKRWVLNIDLADFFPSISVAAVRTLFRNSPFRMSTEAAQTLAELCTYRHGLPQGAPTSPVLSNLAARELDRRLDRLAKKFKLAYTRYADDITFSTNAMAFPAGVAAMQVSPAGDRVTQAGPELIKAVEASGFRIKPSKTRLQHSSQRQEVTGLGVNESVNVARNRIRRLRAMLHAWEKFGLEAAAWEHFRKFSARRHGATPRHFVPAHYWRKDPHTGMWERKQLRERKWPATPDAYTRTLEVRGIRVAGRYDRAYRRTAPPESHALAVSSQPKKYRSFYPGGGTAKRIVPASFRRLVIGHLAYLQMVRGADDPIVSKLCLSVARVDPRPPSFVIQIIKNLQTKPSERSETAITAKASLATVGASAAGASPALIKPPTANPPEPDLVLIPSGKLADRTTLLEAKRASTPAETSPLEAFAMSKFAVTFEDWDRYIGDGDHPPGEGLDIELPSDRGWGRGPRPVINVSWHDAQLYIAWLNHMHGLTGHPDPYRLPTEREWEYACLAGASTAYCHGESITTQDANFNGRLTRDAAPAGEYRRQTMPVGTFAPNAWGLHEMHGNVWEWCSPDPADAPPPSDFRALRGGSWSNYAIKLQARTRWQARADYRAANIGFRLARSLSNT